MKMPHAQKNLDLGGQRRQAPEVLDPPADDAAELLQDQRVGDSVRQPGERQEEVLAVGARPRPTRRPS
jgi:hypothetical protein